MANEKIYEVITPEYPMTEAVYWGYGPTFPTRDCAVVKARNKREARTKALRLFRQHKSEWYAIEDEWRNPLGLLTPIEVPNDPERDDIGLVFSADADAWNAELAGSR